MHESPRLRRLRTDLAAMERLCAESSVVRFHGSGKPVQQYRVTFHGKSLARARGQTILVERHEVEIKLGASYPRTMPEIRWISPIYHPNISEIGLVCLGGYGTHWVPSLNLDELCGMLWDMARFHNYDIRSPYNRDAAIWVSQQTKYHFPLDARPLRDLRAALGRVEASPRPDPPLSPAPSVATPARPGPDRVERYAAFVRKFAEDLRSITPTSAAGAVVDEGKDDDVFILEDRVGPRPDSRQGETGPLEQVRLRAADQEILFID
ncbi:MAG: hypothetical protein NVSMB9_15000 [Isosphaeraceae bacterium]